MCEASAELPPLPMISTWRSSAAHGHQRLGQRPDRAAVQRGETAGQLGQVGFHMF